MKPQVPIVTTIPESNRAKNCDIFNSFRKMSDLAYRASPWHVTIKNETGNLVENIRDKKFKNYERKDNFTVEKLGAKIM